MKKSARNKNVSYAKWGYIFILPFFIAFLIFQLIPLVSTVYYSFFEYYRDGLTVVGPRFGKYHYYVDYGIPSADCHFPSSGSMVYRPEIENSMQTVF